MDRNGNEVIGSKSKIIINGGSEGFKQWNGKSWEQISMEIEQEGDEDSIEEGLPLKIMKFMGLPKPYRHTLYNEFVQDVKDIPGASSLNNVVRWICGHVNSETDFVSMAAKASSCSMGEGDGSNLSLDQINIVSTSSSESLEPFRENIRIFRTDSSSNLNIVTPFGTKVNNKDRREKLEYQSDQEMEVEILQVVKITSSVQEVLLEEGEIIDVQDDRNSNVLVGKPSKHACCSKTSVHCYQMSDSSEVVTEVKTPNLQVVGKDTSPVEGQTNVDKVNGNISMHGTPSKRICNSETSIYCYGVSDSENEGELLEPSTTTQGQEEKQRQAEEVKRVKFAHPSETNIYAYQDYDDETDEESQEIKETDTRESQVNLAEEVVTEDCEDVPPVQVEFPCEKQVLERNEPIPVPVEEPGPTTPEISTQEVPEVKKEKIQGEPATLELSTQESPEAKREKPQRKTPENIAPEQITPEQKIVEPATQEVSTQESPEVKKEKRKDEMLEAEPKKEEIREETAELKPKIEVTKVSIVPTEQSEIEKMAKEEVSPTPIIPANNLVKEKSTPPSTTSEVQLQLNSDLKTLQDIVKKVYRSLNKKGPLTIVANFKPKKDGEVSLDMGSMLDKVENQPLENPPEESAGNTSKSKFETEEYAHVDDKVFAEAVEQEVRRRMSKEMTVPVKVESRRLDSEEMQTSKQKTPKFKTDEYSRVDNSVFAEAVEQEVRRRMSMETTIPAKAEPDRLVTSEDDIQVTKQKSLRPLPAERRNLVSIMKNPSHSSKSYVSTGEQQAALSTNPCPRKNSVTISLENTSNTSIASISSQTHVNINNVHTSALRPPQPQPKSAIKQKHSTRMSAIRPASSSHSVTKLVTVTPLQNNNDGGIVSSKRLTPSRTNHYKASALQHFNAEQSPERINHGEGEGYNSKQQLIEVACQHIQHKLSKQVVGTTKSRDSFTSRSQHVLIEATPHINNLLVDSSNSIPALKDASRSRPKSRHVIMDLETPTYDVVETPISCSARVQVDTMPSRSQRFTTENQPSRSQRLMGERKTSRSQRIMGEIQPLRSQHVLAAPTPSRNPHHTTVCEPHLSKHHLLYPKKSPNPAGTIIVDTPLPSSCPHPHLHPSTAIIPAPSANFIGTSSYPQSGGHGGYRLIKPCSMHQMPNHNYQNEYSIIEESGSNTSMASTASSWVNDNDNLTAPSDEDTLAEEDSVCLPPLRSRPPCHNCHQQQQNLQSTSLSPLVNVQPPGGMQSQTQPRNTIANSATSPSKHHHIQQQQYRIPAGPPKPESYSAMFKEKQQKQKQTCMHVDVASKGQQHKNR